MNKEQVLAVLDDLKSTIYRNRSSEHEAWYQRAEQARAAIVALYEENERLDKHLSGLAAEWRLDAARLRRMAKNNLDSAYHMAAQDSEAHAQELDDARSGQ